jgi:hypothetical protein
MDIKRIILTDSVFTDYSFPQKALKLLLYFDGFQPLYYFAVIRESNEQSIENFIKTHFFNLPIYIFTNNPDFLKMDNFPFSLPRLSNYIPEKEDFILLLRDNKWYEIFILDVEKGGIKNGNESL